MRAWERALRRAKLPIAFTQGFSPRPRIHFGLAVPTCFASTAEYVDVDLIEVPTDLASLAASLSAVLPGGMDVLAALEVDTKTPSLQSVIEAAEYIVPVGPGGWRFADLEAATEKLLAESVLPYTVVKRGKDVEYDMAPGLLGVKAVDFSEPSGLDADVERAIAHVPADTWQDRIALWCQVKVKPRSIRPQEILDLCSELIGSEFHALLSHRSALLVTDEQGFSEPISLQLPNAAAGAEVSNQ